MTRFRMVTLIAGAALALVACGDDEPGSTGDMDSDAGETDSGGGGGTDAGQTGPTICGDPDDPRATENCPGTPSMGLASSLPECPECSDGICVPASMAAGSGQANQLSSQGCSGDQLCAPKIRVQCQGGGNFNSLIPQECESFNGYEGRCISKCIAQVESQQDLLPKGDCPDGKLCAPCYNPLDGTSLGACESTMCDAPQTEPEENTFASCCDGNAMCIPADPFVPDEQEDSLATMGCSDGEFCVPNDIAAVSGPTGVGGDGDGGTGSAAPPTCRSLMDAEGRCLSTCLPQVAEQQEVLPQEDCEDGKLCAPCYNPVTGDMTPACSQGDDMPAEDPVTFETCCSDNGRCVPTSLVPQSSQDALADQGCGSDLICVPQQTALDRSHSFPSCTTGGGNDGGCMPSCFVPDGSGATQEDCESGELCVPCMQGGEPTGACGVSN